MQNTYTTSKPYILSYAYARRPPSAAKAKASPIAPILGAIAPPSA
jgi:hypothetical protein